MGPISPEHMRAAVAAENQRSSTAQAQREVTHAIPSAITGLVGSMFPLSPEFEAQAKQASPSAYTAGEYAPTAYAGARLGAGVARGLADKMTESATRTAMSRAPKGMDTPEEFADYISKALSPGQAVKDVTPAAGTLMAAKTFGWHDPLSYLMFGFPHKNFVQAGTSPAVRAQLARPLPYLGAGGGALAGQAAASDGDGTSAGRLSDGRPPAHQRRRSSG